MRPVLPAADAISKTAIWVAAARAVGAREPDAVARNPDNLAERLLGDGAAQILDHPSVTALDLSYDAAMGDVEVANLVRSMIERTRFIDEALARAVAAGATQLLVIGAGLDSHAWRCRELLGAMSVYEVDRPATQAFKRERVNEALGGPPPNLVFVPLDVEREQLPEALARHGYDTSRRTFVIMEGVTMYGPEEPLRATFRFIASHPTGSSVVFDFASRAMIEGLRHINLDQLPATARPFLQRFVDLLRNEPWVFGLPIDGEKEFVESVGLELRELLTVGSDESVRRYLTRTDGSVVGAETHAKSEAMREKAIASMTASLGAERQQAIAERMREQSRQNALRIAEAVVP